MSIEQHLAELTAAVKELAACIKSASAPMTKTNSTSQTFQTAPASNVTEPERTIGAASTESPAPSAKPTDAGQATTQPPAQPPTQPPTQPPAQNPATTTIDLSVVSKAASRNAPAVRALLTKYNARTADKIAPADAAAFMQELSAL